MEEEVVVVGAVVVVKAIVVVAELEMERVLMTARRGNFMVVDSSSVSVGRLWWSQCRWRWCIELWYSLCFTF